MFKTYLTTAIRNLSRHKSNAIINVAGLMVGFAAFLLIFLVIGFEKSFDDFHPAKNTIYRVVRIGKNPVNREYRTGVPFPVTLGLRTDLPQLANAAAISADGNVQVNILAPDGSTQKRFKEQNGVFFAEPNFFQVFNFPLAEGDIKTALKEPNTALLTKETAAKYFGDWRTAIGKTLKLDGTLTKITGILNTLPPNTDFPLKAVISYATLMTYVDMKNWANISDENYCFIELAPNSSKSQFDALLNRFTDKHIKPVNPGYDLALQPLNEVHYDERYGNFNGRTFSKDLIFALSAIGIFLLVIACVNYINLATAQAINRSREVGVRKVLGSNRLQLVLQFLGETGATTAVALLGALLIVVLAIPAVNNLLDIHLSASVLYSPKYLSFLFLSLVLVTALAGFYPALVLSAFKSIHVLKGWVGASNHTGISFRRGLVVLQFVIAQGLIIGTLVVAAQMDYFRNADLGFRKEAVVNAGFPGDSLSRTKVEMFRNELFKIPGVRDISFSVFPPTAGGGWYTDLRINNNKSLTPDMIVSMKPADTSFFHLYQLPLVAGRVYYPSDTMREFVVNETVVRHLGIRNPKDAIGKPINVNGSILPIVGVVKDYHVNSLRDPIQGVVMSTMKNAYGLANIKIDMAKAKPTIAAMEDLWNKTFPDNIFEYRFLDQTIADFYRQENQLALLYKLFAILAIFISCLGLYGLISFMAVQRKKEIGIRKVLGAPVRGIVIMLSKEFTVLIAIAFLIASPVVWYFMNQWLQQYAYRITIGAWIFAATILGSLCIAWLTVGYTAITAARANPVKSLRTE
jgi:ABC-type antimicrobial peptide transport system permease subunit